MIGKYILALLTSNAIHGVELNYHSIMDKALAEAYY